MKKTSINKNKDTVTIKLNTMFYPHESVVLSTKAFSNSCWVNLTKDSQHTTKVNLKPKSKGISLDTLGYEFYNYVLGTIKNNEL